MSFTHKIVGNIIGDRKSKNKHLGHIDDSSECPSCGSKKIKGIYINGGTSGHECKNCGDNWSDSYQGT